MNTTMMKIGLIAATVMGASLAFSPLAAAGTPSTALKASDLHGHIASTDRSVIVIAQAIAPIGVKLRGDGSIDDSQRIKQQPRYRQRREITRRWQH